MTANTLTISLSVENVARADIQFNSSRVYYRFATIDTCEDGSIPYNDTDNTIAQITQQLLTNSDIDLMPKDVLCEISISLNNNIINTFNNSNISRTAYDSLINILSRISDEFIFIRGFK